MSDSTVPGSAAPRRHRWHEEPGGWSCACGVICDHEAEPCGRHGECMIGQRRNPAGPDIVVVHRSDLSALANVVAVAVAQGQVGPDDTAVRDALARAKEVLGARPTP